MKSLFNFKNSDRESGYILITALLTCIILSFVIIIGAQAIINNQKFTAFETKTNQALDVADAGINYYMWHLTHNQYDYKDGNVIAGSGPYGPFVHNYYDNYNNLIGTYTLTITPPANGNTIVTVQSVGKVNGSPDSRTIVAKVGQKSFADYLFLSDTAMVFSDTATTNGPVHSNGCIQFNGTNNGVVESAVASCGSNGGVWGSGGPSSQWKYPVTAIDFTSVTANLNTLQTLSTSGGVNLGASGGIGWYLSLKSNGTIDEYRVTSENGSGINKTFIRNQTTPGNGVVFSPEEVWVSGTNYPSRVTIVAAKLPDNSSTRKSINVIDNLTTQLQDGSDVIGLIAQQDVFFPKYAPDNMTVYAAMLGQYGSVGFDTNNGGPKSSFTLFGAIAQSQNDYAFKVQGCGGVCKGFKTTSYTYDPSLLYGPPPGWPTTGVYAIMSWREK
jgi:Tfp pilus assembly protein PilX